MHVSTRGVHDLNGAIVTLTPSRLLSDALTSDPIHCWREGGRGLSFRAAEADELRLEVTPEASGLPGRSRSSAEAQVSIQQVFLVLGSRVASYRCKLVLCFLQSERGIISFSLAQLLFNLLDMGAAEEPGKHPAPLWQ